MMFKLNYIATEKNNKNDRKILAKEGANMNVKL